MLFDLRAPGRKRAVQAVYVVLAVVLVGGTILFGVGTNLPGLFGGNNNSASTTSLSDQNKDRLKTLHKQVVANPKDAAAWGKIASLEFAVGSELIPEASSTATTTPVAPAAAKAEFAKAAAAWDKYTALNPDPVDPQVANRMAVVFAPENLNKPDDLADALGLATQAAEDKAAKAGTKVTPDVYLSLLQAQYAAKRTRQATITAEKLRASTPKAQRKLVDASIALAKNPNDTKAQAAVQAAQSGTTGGTITLPADKK